MNKNLRMVTIVTLLIIMILPVAAINYPTYKPTNNSVAPAPYNTPAGNQPEQYGGYSTTTSGGVTTYGEGSAIAPRGPKHAPQPQNPTEGTTYTDEDGTTWQWDGTRWVDKDDETHVLNPSDPAPVGSPLLMLFFAAMAAAVVAWRRKKIAC